VVQDFCFLVFTPTPHVSRKVGGGHAGEGEVGVDAGRGVGRREGREALSQERGRGGMGHEQTARM